jgi:hypothetical protein
MDFRRSFCNTISRSGGRMCSWRPYHTVDIVNALDIVDTFITIPGKVLSAGQAFRRRPLMVECYCSGACTVDGLP